MASPRPRVLAVGLVAVMLFSAATPAAGALGSQPVANTDETTMTEDVSVWQQAGIPLRVSGAGAATTVENPGLFVNIEGQSSLEINKDVHVYDAGESVPVDFSNSPGIDTGAYEGDAQLVVARLDANASALRERARDTNQSALRERAENVSLNDVTGISDLADIIREEVNESAQADRSNAEESARDNVTFTQVVDTSIDADGEFSTEFTPNRAGHYALVAATGQNFSVADGDLSLAGDTTIVGADTVSAQGAASDVTAPSVVTPGEDATFEVNTNISAANHTVVLYDAETYEDQFFELTFDEELDNVEPEDITLNHSLKYVNGTTRLVSELSVMGMGLTEEQSVFGFDVEANMSGSVELKRAVDRALAEATNRTDTNFSAVTVNPVGDATLNFSAVAVTERQDATIDVPTNESWSGNYRWVHAAMDENGSALETNSGEVQVSDDTTDPTVDITRPSNRVFSADTTRLTFEAEYSDSGSGIDASDVVLRYNGQQRFDSSPRTSIGAESATFQARNLQDGQRYNFSVTVTDRADNTASDTKIVRIRTPDDGDDGDTPDNGTDDNGTDDNGTDDGGDTGGGGGFFPPPTDPGGEPGDGDTGDDGPTQAPVNPTPGDQGAEVEVSQGGQFVANFSSTELGNASGGADGVSLESLTGNVSGAGSITVSKSQNPTEGVEPLSDDENDVLSYINVEESGDTNTRDATFNFSVRADRLEQRGIAPENVGLYRNDGSGWGPLETSDGTPVRNGQAYRYTASSPEGFSTFAVARDGIDTSGDDTTTTTEPTTTGTTGVDTTTPDDEESGGFGLAPLLIFLLLGGGGSGGYYAWRRGWLDDLLGGSEETAPEPSESDEDGPDVSLDEEGDADEGVDLFDDEE